MKYVTLQYKKVRSAQFIKFWSKQYEYEIEYLYDDNIGKKLTAKRIFDLFIWKNGGKLSEKKHESVRKNYINSNDKLPKVLDHNFLRAYLNKPGGAIWRIFWLHCQRPSEYPIYDQHVHRAMATMKGWDKIEIPPSNKDKVEQYIRHYLSFWNHFSKYDQRKVDRALWAYGEFLKNRHKIET